MNEQQVCTPNETSSEAALLPAKSAPQNQLDGRGGVFGPRMAANGVMTSQMLATADETAVEAPLMPVVTSRAAGPQQGPTSLTAKHADRISSLFPGVK